MAFEMRRIKSREGWCKIGHLKDGIVGEGNDLCAEPVLGIAEDLPLGVSLILCIMIKSLTLTAPMCRSCSTCRPIARSSAYWLHSWSAQ